MPAIVHVIRRGARYSYRRRLPVPFGNSRPTHLAAFLGDELVRALRDGGPLAATTSPPTAGRLAEIAIYLEEDARRFSKAIDEICVVLQADNSWNADLSQRKRIMNSFAWLTGNKRLCDYRPSDIAKYKSALVRLPNDFKWGKHADRPAEAVLADYVIRPNENRRSDRTVNRDLSTMSKVATYLGKSAWKPAAAVGVIMDFPDHFNKIVEDENEPDRMPWTAKHLEVFFSSRVYLGGGGSPRRLKPAPLPTVWHDASYWGPLIAAYSYMSREEICGLEIIDMMIDAPVLFSRCGGT